MRKAVFVFALFFLVSCSKVPITGRKQLNILPESEMMSMSLTAYQDFLKESKVVPSTDKRAIMMKEVGGKIAAAAEKFLKSKGKSNRVKGFQWEFNLVDDPTVNAWCMSGGKVVFYTGILPITQDEKGLAVVMGHEIAHAIARHGNERMSQQLALQGGGMTLQVLLAQEPEMTQTLLLQSYGVAATLGSLKYSRTHETEADKMGLVFMAMAGYDPQAAPAFWGRMSANGGAKPPEFLSTHPHDDTRINDLNEFMPEALKYYKTNP